MERITSRQNPLITRLRRLGAEKRPAGPRGIPLRRTKLVGRPCAGGRRRSCWRWRREPPPAELPAGVRVVEVPEALLRAVSTVETPQGMLAVCRTPDTAPPETLPEGRLLVLDGVQDPGNGHRLAHRRRLRGGGAVPAARLRRALCPQDGARHHGGLLPPAGVGGDAGGSDRPAGPVGRLPVRRRPAGRHGGHPLRSLGSAAVVIGSEGRGVSQPVLDACRATLKIPMRDRCESLNAAVAASVVLWEGWR